MSAPVIPRCGPDRIVFGLPLGPPYLPHGLLAYGLLARTCVCDCQQAHDESSCWNCGRPARGWRTLLRTAN